MSPEPPPPRATSEALAVAVAPMFAGLPDRERPAYDRASHSYLEPLLAREVAAALVPLFARSYVQHHEHDRRLVARLRPAEGVAQHLTRERFAEAVSTVLRHMPDAPSAASTPTRRAVAHTRLLGERGSASPYVRRVAVEIADRLPYLADLDPQPVLVRAGVAPSVSPEARAEQRRAYMREHRRAARAAEREGRRPAMLSAAAWLTAWREHVGPGAHPAPDLHRAYLAAADRAGMTPLGKKQLFQLADEALGPRKRRASGPVYLVQEVRPLNVEQRRELAALIVDRLTAEWREAALDGLADLIAERRTEQAAPTVEHRAQVVDLASRRALRAA